MSVDEIDAITGGCGPGNGVGDRFVPDRILFLSIFDACRIHDFMYRFGVDINDKREADRVFLNNMVRIIVDHGGWLWWIRLWIARWYYSAVKYFGGVAFWNGKN